MVLFDLDHFKRVHDDHGHAIGDATLVAFAQHLARHLRMGDTVARYGGEEFIVLLPRTSLSAAEAIVCRLLDLWNTTTPITTASAGIAMQHHHRGSKDTVAAADVALYQAKVDGRARVRVEAPSHASTPVT